MKITELLPLKVYPSPYPVLIRAFCDLEKPCLLFSDLAALTAKSENKRGFSTSEKV